MVKMENGKNLQFAFNMPLVKHTKSKVAAKSSLTENHSVN